MPDNGDDAPAKLRRAPRGDDPDARRPRTKVYGMIGQRLRDYFDGVAKQPIPDRFEDLLKELEKQGKPEQEK